MIRVRLTVDDGGCRRKLARVQDVVDAELAAGAGLALGVLVRGIIGGAGEPPAAAQWRA